MGVVQGESWRHEALDLATSFPPAWSVTADPGAFTSGLQGLLAEARGIDEGLNVAVVYTALPMGLDRLSALDLLVSLAPTHDALSDPTYLLERIPGCRDGVYRRRTGSDGRTVHQVARRAVGGLVVWHGWQDQGRRGAGVRLRQIACARSQVRGP
jgi:hypothetical protein